MIDEIKKMLLYQGLSGAYLGHEYMAYAIMRIQEEEKPIPMKVLYLEIAEVYGTSVCCVERNIRTAVKVLWKGRKSETIHTINEIIHIKQPSNSEMLNSLAISLANSTKNSDFVCENW